MEFKFATYTEITDLAFELNPNYKDEGYIRFFICNDVWDVWFIRILQGYNEQYAKEEGCYLLERNNISKDRKSDDLTLGKVKKIIQEDDGSNWDVKEYHSLEDLIEDIDNGFGILNLKK